MLAKTFMIMARKKVLEHQLADLFFNEETSFFEERWKLATEKASDEDFKDYQHIKLEVAGRCLPKKFLCDTRNFLYTITNEMQEWTDEVVMGFWDNSPLEKLAFIMSGEMISQVSIELAMSENTHKYPIHYFDNEEKAVDWLFE